MYDISQTDTFNWKIKSLYFLLLESWPWYVNDFKIDHNIIFTYIGLEQSAFTISVKCVELYQIYWIILNKTRRPSMRGLNMVKKSIYKWYNYNCNIVVIFNDLRNLYLISLTPFLKLMLVKASTCNHELTTVTNTCVHEEEIQNGAAIYKN